jgi:hypothetical protein
MRRYRDTNYWVTEDGRVFRYYPERVYGCGDKPYKKFKLLPEKWKELKFGYSQSKYLKFSLSINNNIKDVRVHQMVAECYLGPCPQNFVVDHIDGNPYNNHYTNLQYLTQEDNIRKGNRVSFYLISSSVK